ncbi:hypothetical protein EC957_000217 [Mortierella hygrophila]|uniref:F-box domain-containing protein n=1 Tax=Mortierella hygrophila TaxID=979708 RepID=A0A9P6FI14_9FUNG|nr:hypothetical protein EC957_000217 [Mortierella hygrophila]
MQPPPPRLNLDAVWRIADYLSKKDLAHCCQVSKAWQDLWTEPLWSQYQWKGWRESTLSSQVLLRVGQYIGNVELSDWDASGYDDDEKLAGARHCEDVLRTCVNVGTLKIHQNIFTNRFLKTLWTIERGGSVAKDVNANADDENECQSTGSMPSSSSTTTRTSRTLIRKKKTGKSSFFRDGPRLAIFSDYLTTLRFANGHTSAEYAMHWLGLAARNGRLQSLGKVELVGQAIRRERNRRHKEPPLRLSLVLLFIRSLPRLKHFSLGQGDIYDDIPDAVVDAAFPPPPEEYIKRSAAAEPKKTSSSAQPQSRRREPSTIPLETLNVSEFDSPSALAKLLRRLPALSTLKMDYLDGKDYLAAIRRFHHSDDFHLKTKHVASDLTEAHWASFFGDDGYEQTSSSSSSLKSTLSPPDKFAPLSTTTASSGGLSLAFGYSSVHGITDRIAKAIAQSRIMSHQLTGLDIYRASNLSYIGVEALFYNCPNLRMLSLECTTISGTLFQNSMPWACRNTLSILTLFNLNMGHREQEFAAAARHHIRQLPQLSHLSLGGTWVLADMVMDASDMGRGERLYTVAAKDDTIVWPKMTYFSLKSPARYVTLPEFKVMLSMFPNTTKIELWAFNTTEVDDWITVHRPDLWYILYSCDYYG